MLGNLADLTGVAGAYVVTVKAAGSEIENAFSGRSLASDASMSWTFTENVLSWHNSSLAEDADADGEVSLADVLAVVTFLRNHGTVFALPDPTSEFGPPPLVDVDNDGRASILDLLMLITELRERLGQASGGEAEREPRVCRPVETDSLPAFLGEHDEDWFSSLAHDVNSARP